MTDNDLVREIMNLDWDLRFDVPEILKAQLEKLVDDFYSDVMTAAAHAADGCC